MDMCASKAHANLVLKGSHLQRKKSKQKTIGQTFGLAIGKSL
jgi:hypothetical protein